MHGRFQGSDNLISAGRVVDWNQDSGNSVLGFGWLDKILCSRSGQDSDNTGGWDSDGSDPQSRQPALVWGSLLVYLVWLMV